LIESGEEMKASIGVIPDIHVSVARAVTSRLGQFGSFISKFAAAVPSAPSPSPTCAQLNNEIAQATLRYVSQCGPFGKGGGPFATLNCAVVKQQVGSKIAAYVAKCGPLPPRKGR
jgi:hypothetical protein